MVETASTTRKYPRLPISRLVSFQEQAFDDVVDPRPWLARTADVSRGGLRLETDRELEQGDRLLLDIAVGDEIVRAAVVVVHVQPRRELCSAGARFETLDDGAARKLLQG